MTFTPGSRHGRPALFLALAVLACPALAAQDWPQWGGPNRDFKVHAEGLADRWPEGGPRRLWSRPLGAGYSAVVTRGKLVYTMYREDDEEVVIALTAAGGEIAWQHRYPARPSPDHMVRFGRGPNATPLVAETVLVTLGYTGILQALDAESGEPRWSYDLLEDFRGKLLRFGHSASPLLFRGRVIVLVGGEKQGVVALDPRDGSVAWRSPPLDVSYASPIGIHVDGQDQVVFLSAEEVLGLDAETGVLLWRSPCRNGMANNASDPLWGPGGLLWVASQPGDGARVLRLSRRQGKTVAERLWADPEISLHYWNAIRVGDHVYASIGVDGTSLAAIDVRSGKVLWRHEDRFRRISSIHAGGKLIFLDEDGLLVLARVSPEKIDVLSEVRLFEEEAWTVPSLAGTTLYVRNQERIVALDLAERTAVEESATGPEAADSGSRR